MRWKGGRFLDAEGYVVVYAPDHPSAQGRGYVREHRLVMEKHLGRVLDKRKIVHHIDGDKTNNRLDNLEIMSWDKHTAHHTKGKPCSPLAKMITADRNRRPDSPMKQAARLRAITANMTATVRRLWNNSQAYNLSLQDLSSRLGVSRASVWLWFRGTTPRPRNDAAIRIECEKLEALSYREKAEKAGEKGGA